MHVIRYMTPGGERPEVGIVEGDAVAEVPGSGGDIGVLALLDTDGLDRVASTAIRRHQLSDVRLLAPVGRPGKILALAGNYHPTDALQEVDLDIATPEFFIKPSTALLAPEEEIPWHGVTTSLIEEIELGVVIGKPGKDIPMERAYEHVFGYTVINDVSARGLDFSDERLDPDRFHWFDWLNGKWLDGYCPVGPWIIPEGEVPDPANLPIVTRINGEVRLESNSSRMIFDIPRHIAYISRLCTLEPGDLIATGVVQGPSGVTRETYLGPGDLVEGTVDGVGTLRNRVADG